MRLLERISPYLSELLPSGPNECGLVAVSGGADSVALLRLLAAVQPPRMLAVVHVNHQLRGSESDGDADFVSNLAAEHDLLFYCESIAVAKIAAETKSNLEDVAREERYRFFERIATRIGATWLATGHTADDQAETLLHRLIRGTGIQGLRGIAAQRTLGTGLQLIRPLRETTRLEILQYLQSIGQTHREDRSNFEMRFTRNRIRHELLPLLKEFNPQIVSVLNRLGEQCEELFHENEQAAESLLKKCRLPDAGDRVILNASELADATLLRVREMFRYLWQLQNWPRRFLTRDHWQTMAEIALGHGTAIDLPEGFRLQRKAQIIQIGPCEEPPRRHTTRRQGNASIE